MASRTLDEKVDEILETLAEMRGERKGWDAWRREIDYALDGNGQPGLKKDVDRLKEDSERRERNASWVKTLVVTNIVGIISFVVYFVRHF